MATRYSEAVGDPLWQELISVVLKIVRVLGIGFWLLRVVGKDCNVQAARG